MKKQKSEIFDAEALRDEIVRSAKAIGLPSGSATMIADKVAEKTALWVCKRSAVTADDLSRQVAKEVKKYSADLAYVYQNRGKII